jgi:metal-responsive CopG/Arc/MetJ family transcriptional regulator
MAKSIMVAPKNRRGRPFAGGRNPHVAARMPSELISQIDRWAAAKEMTRSQAIRRLVELGLTVKQDRRTTSTKTARRAAELAAKVIDKQVDPNVAPEERAERKRRILKGPIGFRDVRKDKDKAE